jgi:protein disulfide-isomerase A1
MIALLPILFAVCFASVTQEEGVYVLGDDNFDSFVESNEFVLVEFYAPWCGHCKNLAPEYAAAAQDLAKRGSEVKLAKVDATVHATLGSKFNLQGYPTIKFLRSGVPSDYEGGRKAQEIVAWILKKSGPPSTELTAESLDDFLQNEGTKVVAHVTEANKDTWNQAAKDPRFEEFVAAHIVVGEGEEKVVIHKPAEEPVSYDGPFESESILKWVTSEAYPLIEELAQPIWVRSQKTGTPLLAVFYEETDSTTSPFLHKIAKAHKGEALFSWSTRVQLLEQWGASGKFVPSAILIKWVGADPKFKIWNEEDGVTFDEAGLEAFLTGTLAGTYQTFQKSEQVPESNDGPVKTVVGKNFEEIVFDENKYVFLELYAPWCGHCKKLTPVWEEVGTSLKDESNVVIAKIDATANSLPDEVAITGFPTLILFHGKTQTVYQGARDAESLAAFVRESIGGSEKVDL